MKHNVTYYSQFDNVLREEWKARACSIVCLKMALDFFSPDVIDIDSLIDEGVLLKGWTPHGWTHDSLSLIAHNHGLASYREEFRSMHADPRTGTFSISPYTEKFIEYGIKKISDAIENGGLVIVSTYRNWNPQESFHTVLLIGLEKGEDGRISGFYYHDPDTALEKREGIFVQLKDFLENWRKMALFMGKID